MINIQQYKPHPELMPKVLIDNNFKNIDGYYSYRFSVYKNKKEPIMWCVLYIDLEGKSCGIQVTDQNNNTYAPFFNRTYSTNNKVVESIDKKINSQLGTFVKKEILKKKSKIRRRKSNNGTNYFKR